MDITSTSSVIEQYALDTTAQQNYNKELGQDEFLELMMVQLKNQDPMEPMDNGEFLGQMAQFSTVSGIESMDESLQALTQTFGSSQTLQTAQLVGQEVLVESPDLNLAETESTGGRFDLVASASDVTLNIMDATGAQVRQVNLGEFQAGRHDFSWDGNNQNGERMPPGNYSAEISYSNGETFDAATVLSARIVDSVEFSAAGQTTLNTTLGETLTLEDVRQIRQRSDNQNNNNNGTTE